ncbi:hypothetical protein AA309_12390 [Microvirga vignae]|uniref:Nodulation protein NopC n=1 Tax=Microvirga vignae TaxID=1225564 RepID=A0A0H1RJP5_9HYPH|nr:hypothetical protein AA309_12390 [Microvirga vignae]
MVRAIEGRLTNHDRSRGTDGLKDRSRGTDGRDDGATSSRTESQAVAQRQAFEAALCSVALQIANETMAEFDEAMDEAEGDA